MRSLRRKRLLGIKDNDKTFLKRNANKSVANQKDKKVQLKLVLYIFEYCSCHRNEETGGDYRT